MPNYFFWGGGGRGVNTVPPLPIWTRRAWNIIKITVILLWLIMVSRYCIVGIIEVMHSKSQIIQFVSNSITQSRNMHSLTCVGCTYRE